jgi:hypothetical protein
LCPPRRRRREGVSQSRGKGKKICVPLKGGKGPPWRVGGSHTGQPAADGVARTVGVKTHPPAIRLVPLPFQGRTKEFPFPRDQAVSVRHSRRGKDKELCPPERGKGPALAGRGFAHGTTGSRRCYSYGRCSHKAGPPSLSGKDKRLPFSGLGTRTKNCVPLKGGPALAGRGFAHGTNESRRCCSYGRCINPSTSHKAGPPSLFPGTRPFLFVTAVAGRTIDTTT